MATKTSETIPSTNVPRVQLGDLCKDMITGYEGICVARTEWLNGCWRVTLQAQELGKDGKVPEGYTFDEPQVEIKKAGKVKVMYNGEKPGSKETGGPRAEPKRGAAGPTR